MEKSKTFLDHFMEEKPSYEDICKRYSQKTDAELPKGGHSPFISFKGCSEEERAVLDSRFKGGEHAHGAEQQGLAESESTAFDMSLPAVPVQQERYHPVIEQISKALHPDHLASKVESGPTMYALMLKLLRAVDIRRFEGDFYLRNECVFIRISKEEVQELIFLCLEREIAEGQGSKIIRGVYDLLASNPHIKVAAETDSAERFFFRNGAYNIRTGWLEPITNVDFSQTYLNCYYPNGVVDCPVFEAYLETVSGGEPLIKEAIWEMLGYLLVPYDLSGKVFFVLQGTGDSGKSVLGRLIASFFNEESVSYLDIFSFKERFATSSLVGKRVNLSMDLPNSKLSKEAIGTIKQITGDDVLMVEQKFKDKKMYKPTCKLVFGTNNRLVIDGHDEALLNRLIIIPFKFPVPKEHQDPKLTEKLLSERPAIAARALAAYRRLRDRNYTFIRPGEGDIWGAPSDADLMATFVEQCCSFVEGVHTPTATLFQAYCEFAAAQGFSVPVNSATFSRRFNEYCNGRVTSKKERYGKASLNGYKGVILV